MANTIGFGQAAVNNTNGFGKAPTNNTIDFGEVCANSWSPETNLTGTGATPSYQNEYSFQFDGVDDYIQTNSTYSELDGQNKMTLSLWMKPISGAPLYEYVVTVPRNSTANEHVFSFQHFENNYLSFSIDGRTTKGVQGNISGINYGQWNHVLCCLDGTLSGNDRMRIYINGVDESYQFNIGTFTYLQNASGELMIGEEPQGAYNPYKGLLDEVAIWSGTDLRDDISTIYNSGVPNDLNNNGLTAPTTWYRMGEAATFDGIRDWNLVDQGTGGNDAVSQNIADSERVTDVPPNPFANTKSILLDGIDDRIECSSLTAYDNSDFSVSIWVKKTTSGLEYVISNSSASSKAGFDIIINSLNVNFQRRTTTKQAATGYINIGFTYNTWHNLIGTYNDTTGDLKLYLDGVLKNTSTASSDSNTSSIDLKIGCSAVNSLFFQGGIDEVSIFNSELSQSDVTNIYNLGVPTSLSSYSSLISWWRCGDGDAAPTLTDNGSGGNNGTMTNFTTFSTDVPT